MPIAELGHVGVWVDDLDLMRAFYTEMMGLTVTVGLGTRGPAYTGAVGGDSETESGR